MSNVYHSRVPNAILCFETDDEQGEVIIAGLFTISPQKSRV